MNTNGGNGDFGGLLDQGFLDVPPDIARRIMSGDADALLNALRSRFRGDDDDEPTPQERVERKEREETDRRVSQLMIDACKESTDTFIAAEKRLQAIRKTLGEAVGYKGASSTVFSVLEKIDAAEATLYSLRKMAAKADGWLEDIDSRKNDDIAL